MPSCLARLIAHISPSMIFIFFSSIVLIVLSDTPSLMYAVSDVLSATKLTTVLSLLTLVDDPVMFSLRRLCVAV